MAVAAFVDWENIRLRLADNYTQKVPVETVLNGIEKVANEIDTFQSCIVFGDWSLRRDDAHTIQQKPKFKPEMVLRVGQKDQTDPAMIAEILETIFNRASLDVDNILVCAGDSNYADAIRRGFARNVKMHVCAVGRDVSKELTALAPFYPLERYLDVTLTLKQPLQATLEGLPNMVDPRLTKLIDVLNSVEQRLPYVAFLYFRNKIMPMYALLAEDSSEVLKEAERLKVVKVFQRENPVNPGTLFRCIALEREHDIVKQIITPKAII